MANKATEGIAYTRLIRHHNITISNTTRYICLVMSFLFVTICTYDVFTPNPKETIKHNRIHLCHLTDDPSYVDYLVQSIAHSTYSCHNVRKYHQNYPVTHKNKKTTGLFAWWLTSRQHKQKHSIHIRLNRLMHVAHVNGKRADRKRKTYLQLIHQTLQFGTNGVY